MLTKCRDPEHRVMGWDGVDSSNVGWKQYDEHTVDWEEKKISENSWLANFQRAYW